MNVEKVNELSEQCVNLERFRARCDWTDAVLSISGLALDIETSALIRLDIGEVIAKRIETLKMAIKKETDS